MARTGIEIRGIKDAAESLRRVGITLSDHRVRDIAVVAGKVIQSKAQQLAPASLTSKRRGSLRRSIKVRELPIKNNRKAGAIVLPVFADAPHQALVEFGTKPRIVRPKKGKLLRFVSKKVLRKFYAFARFVRQPGNKPSPFMRPAIERSRTRVREIIEDGILALLRRFVR